MGKVNLKIKYCLENKDYEYNIKGIYYNNILKYYDNSKMILDYEHNILTRITNNEEISFNFLTKTCIITDNKTNRKINFDIEVLDLKNYDNYFLVIYKIDNNLYKIEITKESL